MRAERAGVPALAASRSQACGSTEGAAARRWQNGVVAIGDLRTPFDPSAADLSDGARSRYAIALRAEWNRLLDDDLFKEESNIQEFLERHPALVPGAFGPSIPSGHAPWPGAVISQPRLPDLSTKRPDFMWIATDSAFLRPVLVEIERPDKRWFHDNGGEQHSDLTTALSQVAHWRRWFNTDGNRTAFLRHYRVPSPLTDRPVRPHFIVVHGRRKEVLRSPAHQRLRSSIERRPRRRHNDHDIRPAPARRKCSRLRDCSSRIGRFPSDGEGAGNVCVVRRALGTRTR